MTTEPRDRVHPVLVVGAGPAGLTAAVTLARQGIDVLVVERRPEGSELPRATGLSVRIMELLRLWGLEERVLAGGVDVEMSMFEMPTVARASEGRRIDVGFPTAEQAAVVSPVAPACVPQDHLESVLLDHLATLGATVVRGSEVVDVVQADDRVHVTLRAPGNGAYRTMAARYVVAADGGRSRVRDTLGIELVGSSALIEGVRAEFHASLWDALGSHRHGIYAITEPTASGTLLPAGPGDRWLFGFETPADAVSDRRTIRQELQRRIEIASGVPDRPVRIDRVDWFSSDAKLAESFSRGRIHLAGDAAHKITPRGGTGLNTAIADGHAIGWRLAWVLRGWAPETFLATYEAERRPVAQHNVDRSADPTGSRRGVTSELPVDLGGRIPHVWIDDPQGDERSTLDALDSGLTLFLGPDAAGKPDGSVSAPTTNRVRLDAMSARAFGLGPAGASLIRPDGILVAAWSDTTNAQADVHRATSALINPRPHVVVANPRSAA